MALQGTIRDFALPDIFQLIGIQRKTGVLTLDSGEDRVTIKFLEGQVVGADTRTETLEDRLGSVLVRTGRITEAQLKEALRVQKNTLQRLGYILVSAGHISEEDLVEALQVQSSQIIYRLFRWREGMYNFDSVDNLDYDQKHFHPISSETILMEGARMIDEWPLIERRIKSEHMVLRKTEAARDLDLSVESILDEDIDFDLGFDFDQQAEPEKEPEKAAGEITLSAEERQIIALVDGERSVREICDLVSMGEFDTFRILSELLTRSLVEQAPRRSEETQAPVPRMVGRIVSWFCMAVVAVLVLGAVGTIGSNPFTPWQVVARGQTTDRLRYYSSLARLEKLESAVQVFYLDTGTVPKSLAVLAQTGYVLPRDLLDPWGRDYLFQVSSGGYQLQGFDPAGEAAPALSVTRHFDGVERMMLGEDADPEPDAEQP